MTTVFIVSGTSYTIPFDCSTATSVETIGAGGGGGNYEGSGGGGGAYSKTLALSLTPGASVTIQVGAGGPGGASAGPPASGNTHAGTAGTDTWFNGASLAASSVGAKGGGAGVTSGASGGAGGAGGSAASGVGSTTVDGGAGGLNVSTVGDAGAGGGGAGGPNGAGKAGGSANTAVTVDGGSGGGGAGGGSSTAGVAGTGTSGTAGGTAQDGTAGGAGGVWNAGSTVPGSPGSHGSGGGGGATNNTNPCGAGGLGGAGIEWDSTHGAGGGGGGGGGTTSGGSASDSGAGGDGGLYGGGGAGAGWPNSVAKVSGKGGDGAQGIIVLIYTSTAGGGARFKQRFNRSPLAYPAGAVPGIDRSHPASNNCLLSAIAGTSLNFRNLLNGVPGTPVLSTGAANPAITSFFGPSIFFPSPANFDVIQFAGTTTGANGFTMGAFACMQQANAGSASYILSATAGGDNGWGALVGGSDNLVINFGASGYDTGLSLNPTGGYNTPLFMAVSVNAAGSVTAVTVNLRSGKVSVSPLASSGITPGAGGGTFYIGSRNAARQWPGWIAAVSYTNTVLSTQQLLQWAKSPWEFWYPNPTIQYTAPAVAAATIQVGWEPQLPLLPHLFYERRGAIARGDDGIETTKINWVNGGWEIQPPPPPHQPREKRGAILPRDDGNELPKINWFNGGWEIQPPPPPHQPREKRGAILPREDGNQLPKINWFNGGWEVQPPPPATANRRNARAAILRGDDGTEGVYSSAVIIITSGWGFDPNLPLVLRPKRLDASLIGDFGNQSPFILFQPSGFEIAPFQPPHPRSERSGSLMRGDDGAQAGKINFFPTGFEAVWHQPNHPRPERSGAIALGDIGYYAPTATVVTSNWGFDAQLWQPPRQIYRAATLPWGDDGIQSQFILFRPTGFEISPVQPPHPRFEQRAAGFLRGDDGNQDILRSWFNAGWEVAPYQPQHVAYAKAGAIMFGDDGTEAVYVFIAPAVGTSTWRTLMGVGI